MAKALKNKFAIVGLGVLAGRYPDHSMRSLQMEAARLAIEDAGLKVSEVDGAINVQRAPGSREVAAESDAFPRLLGMPARTYFQVSRGGTGGIVSILAATKFLELGLANYIVVCVGNLDLSNAQARKKETGASGRAIEKRGYHGAAFGDLSAMSHHSFFASRHMHEYGTKAEQFGAISVAVRNWGAKNPMARFFGKPITIEDYMNSPFYVEPYRLLDICVSNDGAIAFVLTTAERARDLARRPVMVLGAGVGEAMERLWWEKANYTQLAVQTAKTAAFREADITLNDLDFAGLYDCFTAEVLFQLEDYGWCKKGEGGAFAQSALGPGGLAINTSGGLLSAYHFAEITHIAEAIVQLRGEAGERQVPNAQIGMATGHGGEILSPGMCSTHATLVLGRG